MAIEVNSLVRDKVIEMNKSKGMEAKSRTLNDMEFSFEVMSVFKAKVEGFIDSDDNEAGANDLLEIIDLSFELLALQGINRDEARLRLRELYDTYGRFEKKIFIEYLWFNKDKEV